MRKRRLEKQSQGETLLGWDRARGKGRHSLALSVAIPGFSLKMVFLPQRNYITLPAHWNSMTLNCPLREASTCISFLPFFSFYSFFFPCVLCSFLVLFLLFSLCFCPLSVLALLRPPQMEEHSGCCSGGKIKALQKLGAGRTCD